jgi:hypothetical protein
MLSLVYSGTKEKGAKTSVSPINVVATEGFLSSEISDSETVLSTLVHFFYSRFERTATSLLALALARELWWLPRAGHGSGAAAAGPVG